MPRSALTRREFLQIAVATAGAAAGCEPGTRSSRRQRIVPAASPEARPGVPAFYATVCRECPAGCGMVARHRDGRVTKVEGNPDHPIGRGALCARGQAAVEGLYDPDRIRGPLRRQAGGEFTPVSWDEAMALAGERLARAAAAGPGRIGLLAGLDAGSLAVLEAGLLAALGSDRRLAIEPLAHEPLRAAMDLCFGLDAAPRFDLTGTDYILSLGADFLDAWVSPVEYTRQFAALRCPEPGPVPRFVYVGPRLTLTAAAADRRFFVRPGAEAALGLALLAALLATNRELVLSRAERTQLLRQLAAFTPARAAAATGIPLADIHAMTQEIASARAPVVLAGAPLAAEPAATEAAAAALLVTVATGGAGRIRPQALGRAACAAELGAFVTDLAAGQIDVLLLRETNPLHGFGRAPELAAALDRASFVIALASHPDETTMVADLVLPVHTPLEAWADHETEDGVIGLAQPAMGPIHDTRHAGDVCIALAAAAGAELDLGGEEDFAGFLRRRWMRHHAATSDERPFTPFWREALHKGGIFAAPHAPLALTLGPALARHRFGAGDREPEGLLLHAFPSMALYDGRGANRGWLQELPDPVTKAVWGTWIEMHPETAEAAGLTAGEQVELRGAAGVIAAPLLIHANIAPGIAALPIGQGHAAYGRAAAGRGANPLSLVPAPWTAGDAPTVAARGLGVQGRLTVTAATFDLAERPGIAPTAAAGAAAAAAPFLLPLPTSFAAGKDFLEPHAHRQHRWAMVIDVNACTGCSACVTACSAENNVPVVGEANVREGREMAWMTLHRLDLPGPASTPDRTTYVFLPLLCQQCESAPCEPVCPVFAAYHTDEGLNGQVYARCVGTRYCANNCPYKVRRFNWRRPDFPAPLHWQLNPDVTVRDKGVMEKCTFCVQRIAAGKQRADLTARPLADGEIVPACAETCPAHAIIFGDLLDPRSSVSQLTRNHPRRYQVLGELGTRPAVTYLAKVRSEPA